MKMVCWVTVVVTTLGLTLAAGCKPGPKGITSLQRKEAEVLVNEAQFAMTLHDLPRAEGLLAKAARLCPDEGPYWVTLGSVRVKLGNREAAKAAYKAGLSAYETEAKSDKSDVEPWLKQIYVLALLGRVDDGRALLEKIAKRFPDSRNVRLFVEGRQFDRMLADPKFKEVAL